MCKNNPRISVTIVAFSCQEKATIVTGNLTNLEKNELSADLKAITSHIGRETIPGHWTSDRERHGTKHSFQCKTLAGLSDGCFCVQCGMAVSECFEWLTLYSTAEAPPRHRGSSGSNIFPGYWIETNLVEYKGYDCAISLRYLIPIYHETVSCIIPNGLNVAIS